MSTGWEETRARLLEQVQHCEEVNAVKVVVEAADIRAALERDKQYELLRAAVNDSGNCTDDEHGDGCACNADVMLRALRQRVEELEREKYGTPCKCKQWVKACGEAEERAEAAEAKLARCVEALEEIASETEHPCDGVILRAVAVRGLKGAGRAALTAAHSGGISRFRPSEPAPLSSAPLVEALQSIATNTCCDSCQEAALVARAALAAAKGECERDEARAKLAKVVEALERHTKHGMYAGDAELIAAAKGDQPCADSHICCRCDEVHTERQCCEHAAKGE